MIEPEIVRRAREHGDRVALVSPPNSPSRGSPSPSSVPARESGRWTYGDLVAASASVAEDLLDADEDDLHEARVPFLVPASPAWVAVQWGVWQAGGVAVPLPTSHPPAELDRVLEDSEAHTVVADDRLAGRIEPPARERGLRLLRTGDLLPASASKERDDRLFEGGEDKRQRAGIGHRRAKIGLQADEGPHRQGDDRRQRGGYRRERRAMMLYTSGTTGRPKGVVTTHGNLEAQVRCLVEAWEWSPDDRILGVLPLHHVHGIVNVVSCALWSGACCELRLPFDPEVTWERLASGEITLFMAVPTLYFRLIAAWEEAPPDRQRRWAEGAAGLRLMVSGSASLPVPVLERWEEITGHRLLERYGMTEIGMGLSNPLHGERIAGTVGRPLPGVEARLVDGRGRPVPGGTAGEIEIRGPQVFLEYWQRPEETESALRDGWFRTGDEAVVEEGVWRILGRRSVDIIKSGGEKVSALEVEAALREHPGVSDVAVVGVPDPEWGERVVAAVVAAAEAPLEETLRDWCRERLAPWKVPREMTVVDELPRNAMGKVVKPELQRRFRDEGPGDEA